jgi:hypothetical protein
VPSTDSCQCPECRWREPVLDAIALIRAAILYDHGAQEILAASTRSRALVDATLAAAALAGTLSQFAHTTVHSPPGMDLGGVSRPLCCRSMSMSAIAAPPAANTVATYTHTRPRS